MGSWRMCSKTELTVCITDLVLSSSKVFCVQVIVVPKAKYWNLTHIYDHYKLGGAPKNKREVITAISIAILVGLNITGSGAGIAALT